MRNEPGRLALAGLAQAIAERYGRRPPSYGRMLTAAIEARIPAARSETGRWSIAIADIATIAKHFGIA
jgi:hypothetical protein